MVLLAAASASADDDQRHGAPRVVLLASPGAGHLIPLAEMARRLATDHHGVAPTLVTFAGAAATAEYSAVLSSLPASVATARLPAVPFDDLPADAPVEAVLFELVRRSLPSLRDLLLRWSQTGAVAALVPDFFCVAALTVAEELGVPGYVFLPCSLAALAVMRRAVELHDGDNGDGDYRALPDPLELPGGVSLVNADLPNEFRYATSPVYGQLIETGRLYRRAAGILSNTFQSLERAVVEDMSQKGTGFPPVYAVGPFVRSSSDEESSSACLEWLDKQPAKSVVFVSFGSGGTLSVSQTRELAAGLEMSGHRFLWIVRMPSLNGEAFTFRRNGVGVGDADIDDPLDFLPDGFVERTRDRGLAVAAAWLPQVRVLGHDATAAFVSHCGWNSTLESVSAGVPMVAWPLHAEQRMNAVILEDSVGVALRPRRREAAAVIGREEIAAAVKEVMEEEGRGGGVRRRAREMKEEAARAWSPEGSSRRALEEVAGKWKAAAAAAASK
uniref:Glycosyltransferase n=1 Tax=Leersia perrieri TaxID=77586 RepID=A0A0D9VE71_9ORYZ